MPPEPKAGDRLSIGDAPRRAAAEDAVVSISETVTAPAGSFANCVQIKTLRSDGRAAYRYYARDVGWVKETWDQGELLLTSSATLVALKAKAAAGQPKGKQVADPLARVALRDVGRDPRATQYWLAAINNPRLSAHERSDLIEDLNEEGYTNNRRPGPEDLPLILSRIALIEQLAPHAMDKVNADAFKEAYKDLTNMVRRLTGQEPPR
jgi:hypothetical protein